MSLSGNISLNKSAALLLDRNDACDMTPFRAHQISARATSSLYKKLLKLLRTAAVLVVVSTIDTSGSFGIETADVTEDTSAVPVLSDNCMARDVVGTGWAGNTNERTVRLEQTDSTKPLCFFPFSCDTMALIPMLLTSKLVLHIVQQAFVSSPGTFCNHVQVLWTLRSSH